MPNVSSIFCSLALLAVLAGCAAPQATGLPDTVRLPLHAAWFEGRLVQYITTDISDAEVAHEKGANFVPRLHELLPPAGSDTRRLGTALERVYAVVNAAQPVVFPSAPQPVGADNRDVAYSPLWRMVQVVWQPGRTVVELKSEEAVLQAEERGDVKLTLTRVVLNCAVVAVQGGPALRDVRLAP